RRPRGRRHRRPAAVRGHPGPGRLAVRDVHGRARRGHPGARRRAGGPARRLRPGRGRLMDWLTDPFAAPYALRALLELGLLSVLAVGALALGALLASDVYESGAGVDSLLLGSLVSVGTRDVLLTAAAVAAVLLADRVLRRPWAAATFDPDAAGALGARSRAAEV